MSRNHFLCVRCYLIVLLSTLVLSSITVFHLQVQAPESNPYMAVVPDLIEFDAFHVWILPERSDFSVDLYIKNLDAEWALQNASFSLSYNTPHSILSLLNVTVDSAWTGPNTINTSTPDTLDVFVQNYTSPEGDIPIASIYFRIIYQAESIIPASNETDLVFSNVTFWGSTGPIPAGPSRNGRVHVMAFLGSFINIMVENMTLSKTVVWQGYNISINATVFNAGFFTENVTLIAYANDTAFFEPENMTLAVGESVDLTFSWNTTGFPKGKYEIWILSNKYERFIGFHHTVGYVIVPMTGDLTGPNGLPDGKCDIRDVAGVAKLFGVSYLRWNYDPNFDINDDLIIDIADVAAVAIRFGDVDP